MRHDRDARTFTTITTHRDDMKTTKNLAERTGDKLAARTPKNTLVKSTGRPSTIPIPRDKAIVLEPDILEHFKQLTRLQYEDDPSYRTELKKLNTESPDLARYYEIRRRIPEVNAYIKVRALAIFPVDNSHCSPFHALQELEKIPPRMKPNSFIIRFLTEGTDCYSIRVLPGGGGSRSDAGDANTSRIYRIYVLKGILNSEGKIEGESVCARARTVVFTWSTGIDGARLQGWTSTEPTFNAYSVCQSFNLRLVETKTGKVIYTIITQFSIGDAIRTNAGDFITEVTS